jgi:hypothetical protein
MWMIMFSISMGASFQAYAWSSGVFILLKALFYYIKQIQIMLISGFLIFLTCTHVFPGIIPAGDKCTKQLLWNISEYFLILLLFIDLSINGWYVEDIEWVKFNAEFIERVEQYYFMQQVQ